MKHDGEIIEKVIRKNGVSIAELGRILNVNRRSIYNWFNQPRLNNNIISRIGNAINYDFSIDFPNYSLSIHLPVYDTMLSESSDNMESINYWQNKYIDLLEKYNDLLIIKTSKSKEKDAA